MHSHSTPRTKLSKTCVVCGQDFGPRLSDSVFHFTHKRSTCSDECRWKRVQQMGRDRAIDLPAKRCLWCGRKFERRKSEPTTSFKKRVTCGMDCGVQYRRMSRIQRRRIQPYPPTWTVSFREGIRERDGHKCTRCHRRWRKGERRFAVHHIDENKQNCSPYNLTTLCHLCHRQVHRKKRLVE